MVGEDVRELFERLAAQWDDETGFHSNLSVACEHPAFKGIVALGDPAVPLIVERLRDGPDLLFMALHLITGQNPIPHGRKVNLEQACECWAAWYDGAGNAPGP